MMVELDPATVIQASYVSAAAAILLIKAIPSLRDRFLAYGSRATSSVATSDQKNGFVMQQPAGNDQRSLGTTSGSSQDRIASTTGHSIIAKLLDYAASLQVPHSWFGSFYVVSMLSSTFWIYQVLFKGTAFQIVAKLYPVESQSMGLRQIVVVMAMMFAQGARRLYESFEFAKPSSSKMFIGHWIMGIWFYLTISVAVWIEGVPTLRTADIEMKHFQFVPPNPRTFVASVVFILASGAQLDCHGYLSSLKRYGVPQHPAFHALVCPHYFAECLIYLCMAVQAAPRGALINRTILCALVFVAVNLGVTADGTKQWYAKRFGPDSVKGKWRMVPYLF
ncbi:3-oxo-5-alpha-steroid 4-dehydrogenase-like protein 1 [Elsinoe fawcettii]|nr:3-oxo-5-alpha-steroid 4-dehydrogenase-like protein 1 [Elsinoe fawcettii]